MELDEYKQKSNAAFQAFERARSFEEIKSAFNQISALPGHAKELWLKGQLKKDEFEKLSNNIAFLKLVIDVYTKAQTTAAEKNILPAIKQKFLEEVTLIRKKYENPKIIRTYFVEVLLKNIERRAEKIDIKKVEVEDDFL
jgi:hypothetical protein